MSEITGVIRNSMERGWSVAEVKTSLLNAGYNPQEVESELGVYSNQPTSQPQVIANKQNPQPNLQPKPQQDVKQQVKEKYNPQSLTNYQTPEVVAKASNKLIILIFILIFLCVVAGVGLFFFV